MNRRQFWKHIAGKMTAAAGTARRLAMGAAMWTAVVMAMTAAKGSFPAFAADSAVKVEYEDLSRLVLNNQDLKSDTESYDTTISNYKSLLESLDQERDYMKFLAEKYEDDADARASYKSNASILSNTISQINKRLTAQTKRSGSISVEKTIDSYTLTAQTLMNTYNQMAFQVMVKEKSVEAAEASYRAMVNRQASGSATSAEVLEASDALAQEKNLLESYRQQAAQARFDLLSTLGLEDNENVTIGAVPEPDLAAINAIDFEADRETAVNNDASVQSARHSVSGTYTEQAVKSRSEAEAEGSARASILAAYQEIQSCKLAYEAALDSFESASIIYRSLQNKNQAGMLSNAAYLEGEAQYLQALADKENASMSLYQAWEAYRWEVKGVS